MNTFLPYSAATSPRAIAAALVSLLWIQISSAAPLPPTVASTITYTPRTAIVQGSQSPSETYLLTIRGPAAASALNPITVELSFTVLDKPEGFDEQRARSFISSSHRMLTFNEPGQTLATHITVAVPLGTQVGNFLWKIKPVSWPAAANVGTDDGATVNASVVSGDETVTTPDPETGGGGSTGGGEVPPMPSVSGTVFFDANFDGSQGAGEFGLASVGVQLRDGTNALVASQTTDQEGKYSFPNLEPGNYVVTAVGPAGLSATSLNEHELELNGTSTLPPIGFGLKFNAINGAVATGYTIGYWKNNLDKAIAGKSHGSQVAADALGSYTSAIGAFAGTPFDGIDMPAASAVLSESSSAPADLLAKQLLASEYNYQNGGYLNGNATLTYLFLHWGEYVLANPAQYSADYILWAKDWFDAYNNSHGGAVVGPAL